MVVLIISEVFNNHAYLIVLLLNVQFNIMTMYLPLTRSYTQISEIIFLSHMNFFSDHMWLTIPLFLFINTIHLPHCIKDLHLLIIKGY